MALAEPNLSLATPLASLEEKDPELDTRGLDDFECLGADINFYTLSIM